MAQNKINPCTEAIIKTLSYSAVFSYPLSLQQICSNLISEKYFKKRRILKSLKELNENDCVTKVGNNYILANIECVDVEKRIEETKNALTRNEDIFKILQSIPWIKMIGVTGSTANYNKQENKDVDLLFVTAKNRIWLTRGFVFLLLKLKGKLPSENEKREICPNIFIDETNMTWRKNKRNLCIAQNIVSLQPIFDTQNTYFKFMFANRWLKKYYTNFKVIPPYEGLKSFSSDSFLINIVEKIAMWIQLLYMNKKITTEILKDKLIHFNKNDNSKWILTKYKKILKKSLALASQYPSSSE